MQRILYATLALLVLLVLGGFAAPRFARVELTIDVDAPAAVVFAQANDLRRVALWAPVNDADPGATVTYSGPPRGVGATVTWDGATIGSGIMEIAESLPHEYVAFLLNPGEPGEAVSWIELGETAGGTRVTRGFEHDYGFNLVGRYFGLMWTGIVKRDYAASLERLSALVEGLPRTDFADLEIEHAFVNSQDIAYVSTSAPPDAASASSALGDAYFEILGFLGAKGIGEAGPPLSIQRGYSGAELRFDAAIPVALPAGAAPATSGRVRLGRTYEGNVVRAEHVGSYARLVETHRKIDSYLAALGLEQNGDAWEVYASDPSRTPEDKLRTEVVYPVLMY